MELINFQEVSFTGYKNVFCSGGCGRKLKRQKKFWQTLNPFNKNPDGSIKDRRDILDALGVERNKWLDEPELCIHCRKQDKS